MILVVSLVLTSTTHLLAKDFGNLIAYYSFDNIKGNTVINEVDDKKFAGKIKGAPEIGAGKFGKGIYSAGKAEAKRQLISRRHTHMVIPTLVFLYGLRCPKALTTTLALV